MSARLAQEAGITLYTEEHVPVDHARYDARVRSGVRRFARLQQALMTRSSDLPGMLAARLIAFDLVPVRDLSFALASLPYRYRDTVCVEWGHRRGLDRRALCTMTVLCLANRRGGAGEIDALGDLIRSLGVYPDCEPDEIPARVELDRIAWASERLPKGLWAHVVGVRRFALLSRADLGNEHPELVPDLYIDAAQCDVQVQVAEMLDDALAAGTTASAMPAAVQLAADVFRTDSQLSDAENLRHWALSLMGLRAHVEKADVASAIVVAWNYHLVNHGTSTQAHARLKTRARYARVANPILWRMLASLPPNPELWTGSELVAGFGSMMLDPTCTDKRGLGAAISSFVVFLEEDLGISVTTSGLHRQIPDVRPRAKWICPAALRRALRWLAEARKGDPRLLSVCSLMLRLGAAAGLRIAEIRWLRMANIHFTDGGNAWIEVTPCVGRNPLKTDAAMRRVLVVDPATCEALKAWIDKRVDDGAAQSGYLLGDPDRDDRLYRPHAAHAMLLELLKRATGDAGVTFHSLRHTYISNQIEEIYLTPAVGTVNRLNQLAAQVGHVVAATSMEHYGHRIELALRAAMERELQRVPLSSAAGQCITSVKANTLVRQALRASGNLTNCIWTHADREARSIATGLDHVSTGISLVQPKPPRFTGPVARTFTPMRCCSVLQELVLGAPPERIDLRHGLDPDQQDLLRRSACAYLETVLGVGHRARSPVAGADLGELVQLVKLDFSRVRQARYAPLIELLSLPQDAALLERAAKAWSTSWRNGKMLATPMDRLLPVLQLLERSGIAARQLLLCVQPDAHDPLWVARFTREADLASLAVFGDRIAIKPHPSRRGDRCAAYLLLPSRPGVGAAGRSNKGLEVLMFALAVWSNPLLAPWR